MPEPTSIYRAMAGLRWENYKVTGNNGRLAVVCHAMQIVTLCESQMEPAAAVLECWMCDAHFGKKTLHKIVDLSVPRLAVKFVRRPHWLSDIEKSG